MRTSWLVVLLALAATAAGAYAYSFGAVSHWQLSSHPQDWAMFGEYIGGLSVPLLLIGLFASAEGQKLQVESQRQQDTLAELMREARGLALGLEQLLAGPIETVAIIAQPLSVLGKPATVAGVLELVDAPIPPDAAIRLPTLAEAKGAYRKALAGSIDAVGQKLDLLAAVLSEFVSRGGDSIFLLFYRDRFRAAVKRLGALDTTVSTSDWWLVSNDEAQSQRWRF
jgi:hypothetical protein